MGGARSKRPSCDFRHPPVCRDDKSGNRCVHGNNCLYRHGDGEEKPSKKSKKESTQGAVAILRQKQKGPRCCVSQNSDPKKSILRKWGTWYITKIREKWQSGGIIQKGEPHERNPCAPTFEERTPEETSRQEECARKAAWKLAICIYIYIYIYIYKYIAQGRGQSYDVLFSCENKGTGASLQKHRRAYVCGWFGSFNAHAVQERFKLSWNGYFAEIQNPYDSGDRKWGSANKRGSTSVRSWSRSVRHSAIITRGNASSSIAW